jgi:hypothetical protein
MVVVVVVVVVAAAAAAAVAVAVPMVAAVAAVEVAAAAVAKVIPMGAEVVWAAVFLAAAAAGVVGLDQRVPKRARPQWLHWPKKTKRRATLWRLWVCYHKRARYRSVTKPLGSVTAKGLTTRCRKCMSVSWT